jgi:hypothetical protein
MRAQPVHRLMLFLNFAKNSPNVTAARGGVGEC